MSIFKNAKCGSNAREKEAGSTKDSNTSRFRIFCPLKENFTSCKEGKFIS